MPELRTAYAIYKKRGILSLFQSVLSYIIWKILPEAKTKRFISRSALISNLYFHFKKTFKFEQKSILHGQALYQELEDSGSKPQHRVIRQIHRIEKGISMKDRRDVFAEGYIQQTVNDVSKLWKQSKTADTQLKWSIDVLSEYFEIVEKTEPISRAETNFKHLLTEIDYEPEEKKPIKRSEVESNSVTYRDFHELALQRTSTRWFEQRKVPREVLNKSLETALQSPSACNRQSFEFRFYDEKELIQEITELPIGVSGYRDNIPCLAVIVGKHRAYSDARDRHVVYIDSSLTAMSFQYALEAQGLASCCINWPVIHRLEVDMADTIGLDDDEEVIMLMAIGYPDSEAKVPFSAKKSVDEVASFNET
ncbi:nitroreductase family protein [Haloarcula marina]|uniref:nitroreductase family protein n=1 Tax=Haloarcula marina TaxID=2961574 RepID=UPI0020B6DC5B|nr:nitroreductase family protein [Halomicroarcula marina]